MLRFVFLSLIAALSAASFALPASAESSTIRIEPRPFYGATVTLEEGVRVFRPLPTTRHVIINPNDKTPLNLTIKDVRVTEERTINNFHAGDQASGGAPVHIQGGILVPRHRRGHDDSKRPGGMPPGGLR